MTAYCHCARCCGKSDGITASGHRLSPGDAGRVCAAPSSFAFGTVLNVTGGWNGTLTVVDRGGAIQGNRIDVYYPTHEQALQFGVKHNCTVTVN